MGTLRFGPYPGNTTRGVSTNSESYSEGVEDGKNWPSNWNHLPGGPHKISASAEERRTKPDWAAYCDQTQSNHKAWKKGWVAGLIMNQTIDKEIKAKLYASAIGNGWDKFEFQCDFAV